MLAHALLPPLLLASLLGATLSSPISGPVQLSVPPNSPPVTPITFRVDAKNYIVTGGSRGLGRCVARCLASQGAAAVLLTARSPDASDVLAEFEADFPLCKVAYVSADSGEPEAACE